MKPLRVGYFCIIPTLWLKKPVITGYFASNIENELKYIEDENGVLYYLEPEGYRGYKERGKCSYSVYDNNLDELKDIINKIE